MFCTCETHASKRYQRDAQWLMIGYLVLLLGSAWVVKHGGGAGRLRYVLAVLPCLPVIGLMARMGKYLQEETDEYQRLMRMRQLLGGTGTVMTAIVLSDFLRTFAKAPDLKPFVLFFCFTFGMGVMQIVNWMRNRVRDE